MPVISVEFDLEKMDPVSLGEFLRDFFFVGEGYGCYSNFDIREDAIKWPEALVDKWKRHIFEHSLDECDYVDVFAYRVVQDDCTIDCIWWWDGDGDLTFRISDSNGKHLRTINNSDCKKQSYWREA
jgi:hypothetical protein